MNPDRLEQLFDLQRNLQVQTFHFDYNQPPLKLQEWSRYHSTRIIGESYELLQELNIDFQTKGHREVDRQKVIEEGVDIFKFLLNVMLINGVTPEEFHKAFIDKTEVNIKKVTRLDTHKTTDIRGQQ